MGINIFLYAYSGKENIFNELLSTAKLLQSFGIIIHAEPWIANLFKEKNNLNISTDIAPCEFIISIGGDGTFLRAAQLAIRHNKPLFGLNSGRVGFLTETDLSSLEQLLPLIVRHEYFYEYRDLLNANGNYILNDVVISRGGYTKLLDLEVQCNKKFMCNFFADGIIVSTPTGSTGYTLSAGGPVIMPDVHCMIITPICAHSLMHKSFVVSDNKEIIITLKNKPTTCNYQLILDGEIKEELVGIDSITIKKSRKKLKLVCFKQKNFFDIIQNKLIEWR